MNVIIVTVLFVSFVSSVLATQTFLLWAFGGNVASVFAVMIGLTTALGTLERSVWLAVYGIMLWIFFGVSWSFMLFLLVILGLYLLMEKNIFHTKDTLTLPSLGMIVIFISVSSYLSMMLARGDVHALMSLSTIVYTIITASISFFIIYGMMRLYRFLRERIIQLDSKKHL